MGQEMVCASLLENLSKLNVQRSGTDPSLRSGFKQRAISPADSALFHPLADSSQPAADEFLSGSENDPAESV